jgi:hypothetical protein
MTIAKRRETEFNLPNRPLWAVPFLRAYAKNGNIKEALNLAGVSRRAVYKLRDIDEEFRQAIEDALEDGADELEDIARQRAKAGSDVLLMFLLKGLRPWKYRDNHHVVNTNAPTDFVIDLSTADDSPHITDVSTKNVLGQ